VSLLEQQNVLARLLTDPDFRARFLADPDSVRREHGLKRSEIEDILAVASSDLDVFAESLVWKRLREAEKLLPITKRVSGDEFRKGFLEYAPTFNPRSIKKHYEDAVRFSQFLEGQNTSEPACDAARFERTRLIFFNEGKLFAYCRSRYDLEKKENSARPDHEVARRKRMAIAVWLRIGKRIFHFFI
jgi:hypothetical protein